VVKILHVALVRKVVTSKAYFITISDSILKQILKKGDEVNVTMSVLKRGNKVEKWPPKKHVTFVKKIGKSRIYRSIKLIIPSSVARYLGIKGEELVWVRITPKSEPEDIPEVPYVYHPRSVAESTVMISKKYFDAIAEAVGAGTEKSIVYIESDSVKKIGIGRMRIDPNKRVYVINLSFSVTPGKYNVCIMPYVSNVAKMWLLKAEGLPTVS
jgi:hypothetical protein